MSALLEVRDLGVQYGQVQALKGLSFSVRAGEVLTILGANGAGKTSTVRAVTGAVKRTGAVTFDGAPAPTSAWRCRRAGIGHVPEGRHIFASLTVDENLALGAFPRRSSDMTQVFDLLPRLQERRTQVAGTLSGGEQQMLAIGRALLGEPKLLLLDEPTLGLAPTLCDDVFERVDAIRKSGMTLILVEQKTARALQLADQVLVLRNGHAVAHGPPSQFSDPSTLAAAYLSGDVLHPPKEADQ